VSVGDRAWWRSTEGLGPLHKSRNRLPGPGAERASTSSRLPARHHEPGAMDRDARGAKEPERLADVDGVRRLCTACHRTVGAQVLGFGALPAAVTATPPRTAVRDPSPHHRETSRASAPFRDMQAGAGAHQYRRGRGAGGGRGGDGSRGGLLRLRRSPIGKEILPCPATAFKVVGVAERRGASSGNSQGQTSSGFPITTFPQVLFGRAARSITITAEAAFHGTALRSRPRTRRRLGHAACAATSAMPRPDDFEVETGQSIMDLWPRTPTRGIYVVTIVVHRHPPLLVGGRRGHEHHAGLGDGNAFAKIRRAQGAGGGQAGREHPAAVSWWRPSSWPWAEACLGVIRRRPGFSGGPGRGCWAASCPADFSAPVRPWAVGMAPVRVPPRWAWSPASYPAPPRGGRARSGGRAEGTK